MMKKLLLHSCCGPCSTHCISVLCKEYDVTVFYYNPNILPEEEYVLRRTNQEMFIKEYNKRENADIKYIEGDYCPELFHEIAKGRESDAEGGQRCMDCIYHRMKETAKYGTEHGFEAFTTTLSVSPHKNSKAINEFGRSLSEEFGIEFVYSDFKKKDGYKHSIEMSKEYGLYRQNYCGCGLGKFAVNNEQVKSE